MTNFIIKIYLPEESKGVCPSKPIFVESKLYGLKTTESSVCDADNTQKTIINYYVIHTSTKPLEGTKLKLLGTLGRHVGRSPIKRDGINLIPDEHGNVVNVKLNGNDVPSNYRIVLYKYEKQKFQQSYDEYYNPNSIDDHFALFIARAVKSENEKEHGNSFANGINNISHKFFISFADIASRVLQPVAPLFQNTVIYRHCSNWRRCLNDERSRHGFLVLDILLGLIFFLVLSQTQHSGRYFMALAELIVNKLRGLLEMLDGSPAGLKINVQLNNFLLSCFMYHVDLWWNFIVIVEPAIHYLFYPITMFGLMGFSFQCAMLCDVITLITLHAHCFYIYAAMLYKLELSSIRSLLRIVLGRRLNVLKNRVESQDYTNRQLFLATLFFTTLLFLLPTILIYYLVFASLRLLIYCFSFSLMNLQYKILTFPFYKYLRWIRGSYIDASNISVDFTACRKFNNVELCEFEVSLKSCLPWKKSPFAKKGDKYLPKPLSIEAFAKFLVKGEMMAFLPNI